MSLELLHGRHVVLTGFTGFVGKVFAAMLLDHVPELGRLTLLVRGGRSGAIARVERIGDTSPAFRPLRARYGAGLGAFLSDKLQVLESDLLQADLGLAPGAVDGLADADIVVHCAGLTDFDPDPKKALATNTTGAVSVARLAQRLGAHLVHISTCYVAGVDDGDVPEALEIGVAPNGTRFDPEETVARIARYVHKPRRADRVERGREAARELGWPNIYTLTKGLAEHRVAGLDLPLTIVRPSIVECAAHYPFPGWNEGINTAGPLAWLISTAFRRLPARPENRFDIVPVDYVARGMLLTCAAVLDGRAPRVVQLASSDVHPLTFARTIELTGLGLRRYVRGGGGTEAERSWFRHLDPVPGAGGWLAPFEVRSWVPSVADGVSRFTERDGALGELASRWSRRLKRAGDDIDQVEGLLRMYKPFIHDHDWCFDTTEARALNAYAPDDLRFDVTELCWRKYWVDVEYPGLMKWSIPLLRGGEVPSDPPSVPPLSLHLPPALRVASK